MKFWGQSKEVTLKYIGYLQAFSADNSLSGIPDDARDRRKLGFNIYF